MPASLFSNASSAPFSNLLTIQMSVDSINFLLGESKLSQSRDTEVTDTKWMEGLDRWLRGQEHFPSSSCRGLEFILILKWPTTAYNSSSSGSESILLPLKTPACTSQNPPPTLHATQMTYTDKALRKKLVFRALQVWVHSGPNDYFHHADWNSSPVHHLFHFRRFQFLGDYCDCHTLSP